MKTSMRTPVTVINGSLANLLLLEDLLIQVYESN
jgi:hypothetical protein